MEREEKWSHRATIIAAVAAVFSLPLSAYWSYRSLQEVTADRDQDRQLHREQLELAARLQAEQHSFEQTPGVVFPFVGYSVSIKPKTNGGVQIADIDKDQKSSAITLRNIGRGAATDIEVTWRPKRIFPATLAEEHPELLKEEAKLPARPTFLAPSEEGKIFSIPACFESPHGQNITAMTGEVDVSFQDSEGRSFAQTRRCEVQIAEGGTKLAFVIRPMPPLPPFEFDGFR